LERCTGEVCERRWNRDRRRHVSEMRQLEQTSQARGCDGIAARRKLLDFSELGRLRRLRTRQLVSQRTGGALPYSDAASRELPICIASR
jgi:hypothetical protein